MKATRQYGEICMVCEEKKDRGLHILHQFICRECEHKILTAKTNDEYYKHYLSQLRKLKLVNASS
ncbi:sigma factor G inhibitor Gin [Fictibacillus norfolkensis]|jgi:DNA-directed RNA polymerase subunit RPC12/RpoP|uniref:Sigma factor G inhibitor Gin n=1 Tax=Fictibacillus norfolkensis TaxID=2762233 RepID=A0ABR8SRP7_9BACL|nr:sigma factor G inhibitor Gin [Fictibacillus norfolkensis]MBD7966174.1 sigma factor G inhibitor Gin [Fictibacillus norfolkensis]